MSREVITGLLIEDRRVTWATLALAKGAAEPPAIGRADLELGGPDTVTAYAAGEDAARVDAELTARCGRLPGAITIGLPSSRLLLRVVDLPSADPAELPGMVELQADKLSPFPSEETAVSYELLATRESASRVLIVAAHRPMIERLRRAVEARGAAVRRVDAGILGWWRTLGDAGKVRPVGRQALIRITADEADIIVTESATPAAVRLLATRREVGPEEYAAEIAREAAYTLTSIEARYGTGAVTLVEVWHEGPAPDGLAEALREHCRTEIEMMPLDSLPIATEGLARRAADARPGAVDLAPPEWARTRRASSMRRRLWIGLAAAAAVWLLGVGALLGALQYQRRETRELRTALEQVGKRADEVRAIQRRVREMEQYIERNKSALDALLEIVLVQPDDLVFTMVVYKKSREVILSGEAPSVNLIYQFKQGLDQSKMFSSVRLDGPTTDARTRKEFFKINLTFAGAAP